MLEENAPREVASAVPSELLCGLYRRGERPGGPDAGATQIFSSRTEGVWLWYVPLADDLVSVGMASSSGVLSSGAMAAVWEEQLTQCPAVLDRLVDAELTHHLHWMRRPASVAVDPVGTGRVLAGEALFTAGPPFFPVTHWSLESARLAAADVISALQQPAGQHIQPSLPSGAWVKPFLGGIRAGYALAAAMYNPAWDFTNQARISVECRAAIMKTLAGRWDHSSQSTLPRLLKPDAGAIPLTDRMRTVK
jgi:flavin-dependent dehydrogenase